MLWDYSESCETIKKKKKKNEDGRKTLAGD